MKIDNNDKSSLLEVCTTPGAAAIRWSALDAIMSERVVDYASTDGVKKDTGFYLSVLQDIYDRYVGCNLTQQPCAGNGKCICHMHGTFRGRLHRRRDARHTAKRVRKTFLVCKYFYALFFFIHTGVQPDRKEHWSALQSNRHWQGFSKRTFDREVLPSAKALADVLDEIRYDARLDPYNHSPPFPHYLTAIVDTAPIFVSETSLSWAAKTLTYAVKYKRHCYKWQIGISLIGDLILATGPHLGCTSDITIWRNTRRRHPFRRREFWLADLGYVGAAGLITKFKRRPRRNGPAVAALEEAV